MILKDLYTLVKGERTESLKENCYTIHAVYLIAHWALILIEPLYIT
jgi:hypothetical protein